MNFISTDLSDLLYTKLHTNASLVTNLTFSLFWSSITSASKSDFKYYGDKSSYTPTVFTIVGLPIKPWTKLDPKYSAPLNSLSLSFFFYSTSDVSYIILAQGVYNPLFFF